MFAALATLMWVEEAFVIGDVTVMSRRRRRRCHRRRRRRHHDCLYVFRQVRWSVDCHDWLTTTLVT